MVEQVTAYRDSKGQMHQRESDAWQAELQALLASTGTMNAGQAGALVGYLCDHRAAATNIVKGIEQMLESMIGESAEPDEWDRNAAEFNSRVPRPPVGCPPYHNPSKPDQDLVRLSPETLERLRNRAGDDNA